MRTELGLEEQQSEPNVETPEPQAEKQQQPEKGSGNWDANEMLNQHFEQPVRFVTYTGLKDLSVSRTKSYTIWGKNPHGKVMKMPKLHVLFAFPKEKMPDLKPHIKIRTPLKNENLQPIKEIADRYHVDDEILEQARDNKSNVNIVTRAGYVLSGWIQHFDKYVLYTRIAEKMVIVYRHGLYDFTVDEQPEDAS